MTIPRADLRSAAAFFAAVLTALVLGWVNLHNDEVQAPLAILLLSALLLGALRPRHAWIWAIVIALGIPISSLLALKIGVFYPCRPGHPYSCEPMTLTNAMSTFLLLVPALISSYMGVLLRGALETQEPA